MPVGRTAAVTARRRPPCGQAKIQRRLGYFKLGD